MKRAIHQKRLKIANDVMYYIYTNIETDITIDELSDDFNISKFHLQRVFKEAFHRNIYESIKSIRLQKSSSLLLTNRYSTISEIANSCGYSSHSSFIKAFKSRFKMTPKEWRNGGYKDYSDTLLKASTEQHTATLYFGNITPQIVKMPYLKSYYIRNSGYTANIQSSWQKLHTWVLSNEVQEYKQIALFHDNPTITPLSECQYVACIATQDEIQSDRLPQFNIANGIYAKFDFTGKMGDVLYFIHWVYHEWLLENEYETTTKPSYAIYHTEEYLSNTKSFDISFYLPIKF